MTQMLRRILRDFIESTEPGVSQSDTLEEARRLLGALTFSQLCEIRRRQVETIAEEAARHED